MVVEKEKSAGGTKNVLVVTLVIALLVVPIVARIMTAAVVIADAGESVVTGASKVESHTSKSFKDSCHSIDVM